MSIVKSKEIHLISRPNGEPSEENFLVKEVIVNEVSENEVLIKNLWMSVDPYMSCLLYKSPRPRDGLLKSKP